MITTQMLTTSLENGTACALAQYFRTGATARYCDAAAEQKSTSKWCGKGA
jgi:hypothetical protein